MQRIAREGKRIRTTHLEVRAAASPLARPSPPPSSADAPSAFQAQGQPPGLVGMRVGLIVPKYKHSAVDRNRLKRRLRELARLRLLPSGVMADVVIRVRPEAYQASFEALTADIVRALVQLARWQDEHGSAQVPARSVANGGSTRPPS